MAYVYILLCSNGTYYTGSTIDLETRLDQHFNGAGSNYTMKYPPIELLFCEVLSDIDEAYLREKQIQGWSRKKKEALIHNNPLDLPLLSKKQWRRK
jgi:putative endonuclease